MKAWKRIEPTTVTKVGWRKVVSKTFVQPDGKQAIYDLFHPEDLEFTGVVALTPDNQVIIARQFRPGPEKMMDEVPGGFVDPGETPEQAVRRELLEETGYQVGTIEYLGPYHKDAYMNSTWHAFLALDCTKQAEQELEDTEFVEVDLISISQFLDNSVNDLTTDHAKILMAYEKLKAIDREKHS